MIAFDPSNYPPDLAALWSVERLPELGPGRPNLDTQSALNSLSVEAVFPNVRDPEAARACFSGLWLYHDFLDVSHTISQDLEGWIGSYWHGIMHRREPDADNAKYWFRRVSANEVFTALATEFNVHSRGNWDPFAFVDRCERERGTGSDDEMLCRRIQLREMQLLFDSCFRQVRVG
jgi:hypothetical protein